MKLKPIEETIREVQESGGMSVSELEVDSMKLEHLSKVKKMVEYISQGLSEFDAMLLSGYNEMTYEEMREQYPKAVTEIERAKINYKRTLISTLSKAGADGDEKIAQWLLEKQFGEEFNQKARAPSTDNSQTDMLVSAIRSIQENGTTTTLIGIKARTRKLLDENDVPHQ